MDALTLISLSINLCNEFHYDDVTKIGQMAYIIIINIGYQVDTKFFKDGHCETK